MPCTGFRPDLEILRELRLNLDPAVEAPTELGPLIDPEFHSCGTVPRTAPKVLAHPDTDFYIVGMKSYGRAPTFLLATGYEQVRSVAAALAGDREAAQRGKARAPRDRRLLYRHHRTGTRGLPYRDVPWPVCRALMPP